MVRHHAQRLLLPAPRPVPRHRRLRPPVRARRRPVAGRRRGAGRERRAVVAPGDHLPRVRALDHAPAHRRRARARGRRRHRLDSVLGLPRDGPGALPDRGRAGAGGAGAPGSEPVVRAPAPLRHARGGADERRGRHPLRRRKAADVVVQSRPAARVGHDCGQDARRRHAGRAGRRGRRRRLRVRPQRLPAGGGAGARRPLRRPLRARHRPLDGQPGERVAVVLQHRAAGREPGRRRLGVRQRPARAPRL